MQTDSHLWQKIRYVSPTDFIIGRRIIEVDVTRANINILREANIIDDKMYQYLLHADRFERLKTVGIMQANDAGVTRALQTRLEEARRAIFEIFCITDNTILSIRNDAIIFVDSKMRNIPDDILELSKHMNSLMGYDDTQERYWISEYVNFRVKSVYSSYYKIGNKEVLYYNNPVLKQEYIDVAGIGDESLSLHRHYFLDLLMTLFQSAEEADSKETVSLLANIYKSYINLEFPVYYYRRFDSLSRYDIKDLSDIYSYTIEHLSEEQKSHINIFYNAGILTHLQRVYSTLYFNQYGI